MRIAIPMHDGYLAQHFGHCRKFAFVDVDPATRQVIALNEVEAPPHQPGLLPPWLQERGVTVVIAGGIGERAQALLRSASIEVLAGAPAESAESIARQYLDGTLLTGANACDH